MRCLKGGGVLHGVGQLVAVEQELGEQGHLGERVGGVDVADQVVPEVEVGETGQPPQQQVGFGDVQALGDVVHVEVGRLLAVLQVEVGEHRHPGPHRVQVGQPGVTELPAGAEGEGGEPGQAAGQEQQAGVGDAAPGVAASTEGGGAPGSYGSCRQAVVGV